ncbi:two-component system phosphate regulon sensor histidine kinase PhoR [Ulvibacter sp. MAR_2010_11]|uniref:sensor histidine kinase n=1 Tax=Ulvibacter sp. MAR_2010_11 TaxID=1250229 RepID=UPI000C2CDEA6|nr:HAMP domain-containing sensor histidine kinase [Ulvibacter sp. MAR_2010_11]PKA84620.1 two-component system phosphate regulon sensor histidine kinase PhoR [Ulvibacter sp. MAR_2010_11]
MNKKLFALLIALMTLSLLGIIFVQGYWITNAYQAKEDQFSFNVRQTLLSVSEKIQLRELEDYYNIYSGYVDSIDVPDNVNFSELIYTTKNEGSNETYIFSDGILEEDYKLSSNFLDTEIDSIQFKKITNKKTTTKIIAGLDGNKSLPDRRFESFTRLKDYQLKQFEDAFKNISAKTPIHKRVSGTEIQEELTRELHERGVTSKFEYAIYSNELSTKIKSKNFDLDPENTYEVPLFENEELNTNYVLFVNFSGKKKEVLSSILGMAMLSLVFTGVIILAYSSALSQLFKQRQISEIKSDFINNMTHEFKTPIATINLALDALKNPKVKDDSEFLSRYLGMIRDENRRMHAQVENVLRISKLEKNELDLPKERLKLHEILETSISHVALIIEDRGGYIETHFGALKSSVLGNESHLTNVMVNILDNAIKYSEDTPKIDIYTENVKNTIILKIRDQGMGMSKGVQKRIFEKFYREATGDIHNVKGHGLGLAYVKRILDDHDAEIYVESEKGKGSTFILKLHLIS